MVGVVVAFVSDDQYQHRPGVDRFHTITPPTHKHLIIFNQKTLKGLNITPARARFQLVISSRANETLVSRGFSKMVVKKKKKLEENKFYSFVVSVRRQQLVGSEAVASA